MSAFGRAMRDRREQLGWTQRDLAGRAFLNPGYVAKLERGTRNPSREVAEVLDRVLDAGGSLAALVNAPRREPSPPMLTSADVEGLHGQIRALVADDITHGADGLWRRAGREFRRAHEALAAGRFPDAHRADLHAAVGELGEVAGWLAYDAGRPEVGRRLMTDALLVSQLAGDAAMEGLQLNLLALLAQEAGRYAEALALADRGLALAPPGGRVEAMHRLRRGGRWRRSGRRKVWASCRGRVPCWTGAAGRVSRRGRGGCRRRSWRYTKGKATRRWVSSVGRWSGRVWRSTCCRRHSAGIGPCICRGMPGICWVCGIGRRWSWWRASWVRCSTLPDPGVCGARLPAWFRWHAGWARRAGWWTHSPPSLPRRLGGQLVW